MRHRTYTEATAEAERYVALEATQKPLDGFTAAAIHTMPEAERASATALLNARLALDEAERACEAAEAAEEVARRLWRLWLSFPVRMPGRSEAMKRANDERWAIEDARDILGMNEAKKRRAYYEILDYHLFTYGEDSTDTAEAEAERAVVRRYVALGISPVVPQDAPR